MGFNTAIHCGNFSSSEIVRLTGSKKVRDTYIAEKNTERRLGRTLKADFDAKDVAWGYLMEFRVLQQLLGIEYSVTSDETLRHPKVDCWVGSPDATKNITGLKTVCDVKGLGLKAFCEMIDAFSAGGIQKVREVCDSGEKFYQQIVSNGCITGVSHGELILYCPYKSELDEVRRLANDYTGPHMSSFKRFGFADDDFMPYLPDGGHYKNLNFLQFPLPAEDRIKLHNQVVDASKELVPFTTLKLTEV